MKRKSFFSVGFLLCAALPFCGCGHKTESGTAQTLPAASVRVQTVESLKRVATEEVVGTVRPKLRSVVEAKVSGKLERMLVVPGQQVKPGEVLAVIDAREVQARLDQALAVRQQAEGDLKRFTLLLDQKILSQSEYDNAQSKFLVADAAVKEAETMLGHTKVTAPFAGVITRKHADVGDLAAPGKPLLEMEDPKTLRLEADVPEALLGRIALGDKLSVRVPAVGAALEGTVSEIAPVADANSRTFPVKLDLPSGAGLRSGQFGRLAVPVAEVNAIRVPASAVIVRGQMEIAFVVADGRAQMRLVKTGKHLEAEVEIVAGLNPGEQIVVDGTAQLLDGQPVEVKR